MAYSIGYPQRLVEYKVILRCLQQQIVKGGAKMYQSGGADFGVHECAGRGGHGDGGVGVGGLNLRLALLHSTSRITELTNFAQ